MTVKKRPPAPVPVSPRPTAVAMWTEFARRSLPARTGPVARENARRAYYAGMLDTLVMLSDLQEKGVTEEAGVAAVAGMMRECTEFEAQLARGSCR